jgi:rubrerythrin
MNLGEYSLEDLILSAIRAEIDANGVYTSLAEGVENAFLKERLLFLAGEEEKHRAFLEELYGTQFMDRELVVPETSPVPLPEVRLPHENVPLSQVFGDAMEAERAAADFYTTFAERFVDDLDVRKTLHYFASMEMGHYNLLAAEKDMIDRYEDYDEMWPMMHVGP